MRHTLPLSTQNKAEAVLNLIRETLKDIKKYLDEDNEDFIRSIQNEMKEKEKIEIEKKKIRLTESQIDFRNLNDLCAEFMKI